MTLSEFWDALDRVFGPALGRSLVADLYLTSVRGTAREALDAGTAPEAVWAALVAETDRGEEARWAHRRPFKGRGRR